MGYEEDYEDYEDYEDEDFGEDCEDEVCPEGYTIDECCGCVARCGIEVCEFECPFGGLFRCDDEQVKKCLEELKK